MAGLSFSKNVLDCIDIEFKNLEIFNFFFLTYHIKFVCLPVSME